MTRRALTLLPCLLCLLAAAPARADDPPSFALTTDTLQYCAQLAKQVTDRHSTIPDVQRLLADGTDMCGRGQIRGGIRRLRRALVILHHHKPAKDQPPKPVAKPPQPTSPPPPH
jgi:hypothetical protein